LGLRVYKSEALFIQILHYQNLIMIHEKLILSAVDYVFLTAMLLVSAGIGLYFQMTSKKKTSEEFLLAGKNMSVLPVAFSLMATFMSSTTIMGIPAEMYLYGTNMTFMNLGFIIGPIITSYLFLPIYFANDVSTAYEYLEKRFGKTTRRLISAMFAFKELLFTAATLYAPALALSAVTNLSMWMSVIVIGVVCTFYCTLGGMKAVLWTDVFQATLMYIALFAIIINGCLLLNGFGSIFEIANEWKAVYSEILKRITYFQYICSRNDYYYKSLSPFGGSLPNQSSNTQESLKNINKSKRFCDPLTSADRPIQSADQLLPYFITTTLSYLPGLPGLCMCGIFSASLSTVSSAINSLASVTSEDFLKTIFPKLKVTVFHNKVISE
ncbi:sodium-coupled monocarboxylate transporter 2, partial [Trichonephila inaurata madagascariensis]